MVVVLICVCKYSSSPNFSFGAQILILANPNGIPGEDEIQPNTEAIQKSNFIPFSYISIEYKHLPFFKANIDVR